MTEFEDRLRGIALSDEHTLRSAFEEGPGLLETSRLDARTFSLVRIAALLAVDAAPSSYQAAIDAAILAGASVDEIVGTLFAIAPSVGAARIVSAAPELALALGYDVDAALESGGAPGETPSEG